MLDLADVDLVGTTPRLPLLMELTDAMAHTLDRNLPDEVRHYWHGVTEGYMIGFGLADSNAHSMALCHPYASADAEVGDVIAAFKPYWAMIDRQDFSHASGVLHGYKVSTGERADAEQCAVCQTRILTELDEHTRCFDGALFCERPSCANAFDHSWECDRENGIDADADDYVSATLDGDY